MSRSHSIATALLFVLAASAAFEVDAAPKKKFALAVPLEVGSITPGACVSPDAALGATFKGKFTITKEFKLVADKLFAVGVIEGTLKQGVNITKIVREVEYPISNIETPNVTSGKRTLLQLSCPVLNLDLGPLSLDLLGLVVNLNQVVLDIVAQSGAGKLVGNLVCAVANLLNGGGLLGLGGLLGQVVLLLNQILGTLLGNLLPALG